MDDPDNYGQVRVWKGRVTKPLSHGTWVDCSASRFTGASIAGLVVAALMAALFAWALVGWRRQRKAWREKTAGALHDGKADAGLGENP